MKLKSLIVALGIASPLALLSSSYVPSTNPRANDLLRQANEARRARQGGIGANVMTIDRLNNEEKERQQQQQQQANNASQQAAQNQAQQQTALMGQQAAQAQQQAAQAEQLAQLQAQVQRQEDERRRQAEELASLKVAMELQRQENERARQQRPFSGQQENKEQEQKQNANSSSSSSSSRPAAPAPANRKQQVQNSLRAVNSTVNNAGSGLVNYGRQAIGLANDNLQSINQQIDASAQKGDDLLGEFEAILAEEVAPVANGAINIADRILNMNRYWNPGKDDRPKNNNNRRANNNTNTRPKAPVDSFKKQGL